MPTEKEIAEFIGIATFDDRNVHIWSNNGSDANGMLCEVQGWARISSMFPQSDTNACDFQDCLGRFIADAINEKVEKIKNIHKVQQG